MTIDFIHLRVHSEYSLVDGILRIKPLINACAQMKMPAIAMTDHNNLFAAVKFYKAAIGAGIKPIIGCDVLLAPDKATPVPQSLVLLAQNNQGYLQLTQLISKAYLEGQHHGVALIARDWLAAYCADLIVLSGGKDGDVGKALLAGNCGLAQKRVKAWVQLLGDRYYLELQRSGSAEDEHYIAGALELARSLAVPVVATNQACFLTSADFDAHEARICIHEGYTLADPSRVKRYTPQHYLKSPQEMLALFADIPSALTNSVEIAKRCNWSLQLGEYHLPNFPVPQGSTMEVFFNQQAQQGLEQRLATAQGLSLPREHYDERLKQEVMVISNMGFSGYFLIVADFIGWAKQNGVSVGPGRGSGAGSLVAYALGITDLDPLQYDLLFERFLNPERVSMPDFDVFMPKLFTAQPPDKLSIGLK